MYQYCQPRRGFTLIELLVVMALIAILATLAIAFFPNAASSAREARAGTQLQGLLSMAKQRALRDQAPRGLRLWVTTYQAGAATLNGVVTDCQFIEQPDDFPASPVTLQSGVPVGAPAVYNNLNTVQINTDLVNGNVPVTLNAIPQQPSANPDVSAKFWTVQPGDNLEILGTGLMHTIIQIGVPDNNPANTNAAQTQTRNANFVVINPPLPYPVSQTANFRIVRAPRVTGDETLKLPDGCIIDLGTNTTYGNPLPPLTAQEALDNGSGFIDILFSPSGEVISPGVTTATINLWVRAPSPDFPTDVFRGDPTIVAVFTKTGFVGAYPPSSGTPATPYLLVK